jgi:hypothetical protein
VIQFGEVSGSHCIDIIPRLAVSVDTSVGKAHVLVCPGSGCLPPAVLVHGVCSTAHDYFPLITRLQKLCETVLVVDLPGDEALACGVIPNRPIKPISTFELSCGPFTGVSRHILRCVVLT